MAYACRVSVGAEPKPFSREAEVAALGRALAVERRARYIDFRGKRANFSQFMRQTADKLCKRYPLDSRWSTIRGLFTQYPNLDVASRISIVRRTEELLFTDPAVTEKPTPPISTPAPAPKKPAPVRPVQDPHTVEVKFVKGVGPKMSEVFQRLGIFTAGDLIRHYPRHHLDFQNRMLIRELRPGMEVTVFGIIRSTGAFQSKKGNVSILSIVIGDGTGSVLVSRFIGGRSNKYLLDRYKSQYPKGAQVLASGVVERDRYTSRLQLKNAELEILSELGDAQEEMGSLHTNRLVPVYPLTEGIGLRYLRGVIHNALEAFDSAIVDPIPEPVRLQNNLIGLKEALWGIHFPDDVEIKDEARKRLVFDELFGVQLQLAHRRYQHSLITKEVKFDTENKYTQKLRGSLPFTLTGAQERVFKEIANDLASSKPMHRLVQGDVGSGKTVVAAMAALLAIGAEECYQVAVMAPTEILAEQHYRQFQKWLTPLGLRCGLFLGKQGTRERREMQQALLNGQMNIAVGTHALIQDDVEFANLGFIIIDEQHRFGVKQRAKLKAKGMNPELLTMTATPIPRTLAMTIHGDLDVSEIDELPPGRKPISTQAVWTQEEKRQVHSLIAREVDEGRQAYIVFPLIEESETLSAKAATAEYETLKNGVFGRYSVGLMHGKLKPQEKEEVMDKFRNREIQILVCTTVIEVGVDVPNASVMVIENADRFGLAQLHQLRGRVGRGSDKSYCFLVSNSNSENARSRLEVMEATNDGFVVAQKDLEIRGPGEFLGTRQSGLPDLVLADLVQDATILEQARKSAIDLIKSDPDLKKHPSLKVLIKNAASSEAAQLVQSG